MPNFTASPVLSNAAAAPAAAQARQEERDRAAVRAAAARQAERAREVARQEERDRAARIRTAQSLNPNFVAGKTYGCTDNITKNGRKSKSFTVGMYYICVENHGVKYLVSNSGKLVEVGHFGSLFVDFPA